MDPHAAEIVSEPRLEIATRGLGEGTAAAPQGVYSRFNFRCDLRNRSCTATALTQFFLLPLRLPLQQRGKGKRFGANLFVPARGTIGKRSAGLCLHNRFRHPHDLVGDAVGFLLVDVVGRADCQLSLDQTCPVQPPNSLIADRSLENRDVING